MLTDIKLSRAPLSKIINSGRFLGNVIGNLGKKHFRPSCSFN